MNCNQRMSLLIKAHHYCGLRPVATDLKKTEIENRLIHSIYYTIENRLIHATIEN
jgi:hypothetical protein